MREGFPTENDSLELQNEIVALVRRYWEYREVTLYDAIGALEMAKAYFVDKLQDAQRE